MKKIAILLGVIFGTVTTIAEPKFPDYAGFVNDFARILGDSSQLDRRLEDYASETGNQVVVVTVETADPLTPQQYAEELFDAWKPGQKGKDNGVIILNAVRERRVVIRTGYGLEGQLPDAKVGRILDTTVIPHFKDNNPLLGFYSGVEAVIAAITPGLEKTVPKILPPEALSKALDIVPCEDNPDIPVRTSPGQHIQNFEKSPHDEAILGSIRETNKTEVVIVGVDALPKGISGRRLAECIAQNWNLGASLHRKGKGMAIVADRTTGTTYVGLGDRLKEDLHAGAIEDLIRDHSGGNLLAISDSLPVISSLIDHRAGDDWEDIVLYTTFGFVVLGLIILVAYLLHIFIRGLLAACPKCRHRFPRFLQRVTARVPTTRDEGLAYQHYCCRHCDNKWTRKITLAALTRSSSRDRTWGGSSGSGGGSGSSGSGGFGGGSSGGGGADRGY